MAYKIHIVDAALLEAEDYIQFILKQSNDGQAAAAWKEGLYKCIESLQNLPTRCPLIPEQPKFKLKMYQLIYESHRIIFHVAPGQVTVLRIYHASRHPLKSLRTGLPKPDDKKSL